MFILYFIASIISLSAGIEQDSAAFFNGGSDIKDSRILANARESLSKPLLHNATYVDKQENPLRVPSKYFDENKSKKKIKKPPKRTVQKIIKKNKLKSRKIYLFPATVVPTLSSKSEMFNDELYTRQVVSTTENISKKRPRKNPKYVRYPMPFQKLQRRDGPHIRFRREDRDVYILNDLDEMEFLSKENDHDTVIAHVQKYW